MKATISLSEILVLMGTNEQPHILRTILNSKFPQSVWKSGLMDFSSAVQKHLVEIEKIKNKCIEKHGVKEGDIYKLADEKSAKIAQEELNKALAKEVTLTTPKIDAAVFDKLGFVFSLNEMNALTKIGLLG